MEYDGVEVHPYNGLAFRTFGHYGSTVFDPAGMTVYLDIVVCDACIVANLESVRGTGKGEVSI